MNYTPVPGLVSVIVASYNHAGYLTRRMNSLIAQTYRDIEILVIDDCSTDNSLEVLESFATQPRVAVVRRETNAGWVVVSNQGLQMTKGEFVLFANCDDDCDHGMIERLVGAINQNPTAGIAFCRSLMVNEHDRVLGDDYEVREKAFRSRCAEDAFINRNEMRRFLLHSCVIPNLSAALIKRRCFSVAGILSSEYRACSDWDLFFRIANHFDFCYVAEPLNRFRQHTATIRSATKGRVTYDEFFRLLLGEIRRGGLTNRERFRFRLHVMYLWSLELVRPSAVGWKNVFHHLQVLWPLDPLALPLLPLALFMRLIELPRKGFMRLLRRRQQSAGLMYRN